MIRSLAVCSLLAAVAAPALADTLINFDDRPGMAPPFSEGTAVAPEFLIHDQYLALGVRFDSGGGGVFVSAPSNPVSGPNSVGATSFGPVISYHDNVSAEFLIGGSAATVDLVSLILSNSSSLSTLEAFDTNNASMGTSFGGAGATLSLNFPGQIQRIVLSGGPFAFDDFRFNGLAPTPGAAPLLIGATLFTRRRR